jgi:hypothetical protein
MRLRLLLLLLFITFQVVAQFPMSMQGQVTLEDKILESAHVTNLNSQGSTTTDNNGIFWLQVDVGDVLLVSHVSAKEKFVIIHKQLANEPLLSISLEVQRNELDEVIIKEQPDITVQSVGIIQGEQKIPTANERRLHTAGDFKPIHLLSLLGGSLQVDPIINAITGRTKRLKRYVEIDKKIAVYESLYEYHAYFVKDRFEIDDTEVKRFFNELVDHPNITALLKKNNEDQIRIWLCAQYLIFSNS